MKLSQLEYFQTVCRHNNLTRAVIHSRSGGPCSVHYKGQRLTFDTQRDQKYTLSYQNGKLAVK